MAASESSKVARDLAIAPWHAISAVDETRSVGQSTTDARILMKAAFIGADDGHAVGHSKSLALLVLSPGRGQLWRGGVEAGDFMTEVRRSSCCRSLVCDTFQTELSQFAHPFV